MTPTYKILKGTKVLVSDPGGQLHEHVLKDNFEYTGPEIIDGLPNNPDGMEAKFTLINDEPGGDGRVQYLSVKELKRLRSHVVRTKNEAWPYIVCEQRTPNAEAYAIAEEAAKAVLSEEKLDEVKAKITKAFEESFQEMIQPDNQGILGPDGGRRQTQFEAGYS